MPEIGLSKIKLTGWNPRKEFNEDQLNELKNSIKEYGILEPLIVRQMENKSGKVDNFQLVAGERRYRVAVELKITKVPVVIKDLSDQAVREIMLIENLQRSSLSPFDEAIALEALLMEKNVTQEILGKKLGKSQSWIANRLRLIQAPEDLKDMVISREITAKHVLTLLPYQEYPVYKDIMKSMKKHLDQYHDISVIRLKEKIDDVITVTDSVLCITDLPWKFKELEKGKFLDLKDCQACKKTVDINQYGYDQKYCIDGRCWKDKLNLANQAYDKKQKVVIEELAKKGKIDTSKIDYDTYNILSYEDFDKSECEGCDQYKLDKGDRKICLDPACFKKKKSAHSKEVNKTAREDKAKAFEVLDKYLENLIGLDGDNLRIILNCLVRQLYSASVKEGLKPWGTVKEWDDIKKIVKSIPNEELCRAIFRIVIIQYLSNGTGETNQDKLKKVLPEAFK